MAFEVKKGSQKNKNDLTLLYQDSFGKDKSLSEYKWMYEKGLYGFPFLFLMYERESARLVGAMTTYIRDIKIFNKEDRLLGGHDHMVHPDFQRKGLYKKILFSSTDTFLKQHIKYWLTFPNNKSWGAFQKYTQNGEWDYQNVGQFYRFIKPLRLEEFFTNRLHKYIPRIKWVNKLYRHHFLKQNQGHLDISLINVKNFNEDFDQFWEDQKKEFKIILSRTTKYLNWRYIENPNIYVILKVIINQRMYGYCIYKKQGRTMVVLDFMIKNKKEIINSTINKLIAYGAQQNFARIQFVVPKSNIYVRFLLNNGFFKRGVWCNFGVHRFGTSDTIILNENDWFLTLGDVEHT
jgi:hypothetical protein